MLKYAGSVCRWIVLASFMCLAFGVNNLQARERILSYTANIEVMANSDLIVEEIIKVRSERRSIRRGIYRDFPIRYKAAMGSWRYVGFKVLAIKRDGKSEAFHTENFGDYKRIYIGNKNVYLSAGEYTYSIKYRTTRQLRYFEKIDELFWNVTGNFWKFPIDFAVANITLPKGARIIQSAGYTGILGARGNDFLRQHDDDRHISFETTREMRVSEGLTIAVGWNKGVVAVPGTLSNILWRLWSNIGLLSLLLGAAGAVYYFLRTWDKVGRDPEGGTIIPLFKPPADLSPAAISYLHFWGFKKGKGSTPLAFVAGVMSLAVKGRLKIVEKGKKVSLERVDSSSMQLGKGEVVLEKKLLTGRSSIAFNKTNGPIISSAMEKFKTAITNEYGGKFFNHNYLYFIGGAAISVVAIVAYFALHQPSGTQLGMEIAVLICGLLGTLALFLGLVQASSWRPFNAAKWWRMFFFIIAAVFLGGALFVLAASLAQGVFLGPIAFAVLAVFNVSFFFLLRAPTIVGAKMMDDIEGFKLYLSTAEESRMNMVDVPDMSTDLYEKYLPYAIGLGVEKPWSKSLSKHLAATKVVQSNYHPTWYSGRNWNTNTLSKTTAGLVSSISSATASAMPQTSSGSSGGGFSGGGGGGGGGGGW